MVGLTLKKLTSVFRTVAQCYANYQEPTLTYLMLDHGWADVEETNVGLPDVGTMLCQLPRTNVGLPNVGPWLGRR